MLLAACGSDEPTTTPASPTSGTDDGSSPSATTTDSTEPDGAEEPAGESLAAVDDIPEGGALVVEDGPGGKPVVLARPQGDEVVAFSAVCTHQGCTVRAEQSSLVCPCHGSTYDLSGDNTGGPAPSPLPPVEVRVADGQVRPA
jgi:Rieske Fe-S protein